MSKIIKQICCAKIYRGYQSFECGKPAKVESNKKFYCGVHDPEKKQAKHDKLMNKYIVIQQGMEYDLVIDPNNKESIGESRLALIIEN